MSNATNLARLATALLASEAGILTAQTTPALDDNTKKLATTEFLLQQFAGAGKQLKSSNGYQKLPGGIILQWGTRDGINNSGGVNVMFPLVFPNACFAVVATHVAPGTVPSTRVVEVVIRGVSYFDAYGNSTANAIYWFAVGH